MKKICFLCFVVFVMSAVCFASPIFKYENVTPITDSITLTQVREFYSDCNMSYSYIKADLNDENISLELLKSEKGPDVLENMATLASTKDNTVAALNGDFFSSVGGGRGFSLGIEMKDSSLLQSPIYPETMASIGYDGKDIYMDYGVFSMSVVAPNGNECKASHLNKSTTYYGDILVYTSLFNGGYSPAPGADVVELVVSDGKVVEFRRQMEPVKIPEDGYVLVVSEGLNMFLANNFNVGDEIELRISMTPDFTQYGTAFGGGAFLVYKGQDYGKISDYTHEVAGLNPRSAIGISEDGKTLILLAVDGRQNGSRGMRMSHTAELLIELGCYYAVNLDGGGSTRMVASTLWQNEMHAVNNPTENRKVINAVGLGYNREKGEPYGISIKPDKDTVFKGQKVNFDAVVYDKNGRSVEFDKENIVWSASFGSVEDGVYTADSDGFVTVSASIGELYCDYSVYVIDKVSGILVNEPMRLNVNDSQDITVSVFDYTGKCAKVSDFSEFEITSSNTDVVRVENGVIMATGNGNAQVCVSKNGVFSYISVSVGGYETAENYDFEDMSDGFSVYPEDTKADGEYATNMFFDGNASVKLTYDFTQNVPGIDENIQQETQENSAEQTRQPEVSRAVYVNFDEPFLLHGDSEEISVMVFSETEFLHTLRAELDIEGSTKLLQFEGQVKAGEWSQLTLHLPGRESRSMKLKRIYVLYSPGQDRDSGSIYIDSLSFSGYREYKNEPVKAPVFREDKINSSITNTVRIASLCSTNEINPVNVVGDNMVKSFVGDGFILGENSASTSHEDQNALYIFLDTSAGGIRKTNNSQWNVMSEKIASTDKRYVFLLCQNSIFGSDEFENEVIKDFLASVDKEVVVVTSDNCPSYIKQNGVTYLTLDNSPKQSLSLTAGNAANALEFYFGESLTFEFKSV